MILHFKWKVDHEPWNLQAVQWLWGTGCEVLMPCSKRQSQVRSHKASHPMKSRSPGFAPSALSSVHNVPGAHLSPGNDAAGLDRPHGPSGSRISWQAYRRPFGGSSEGHSPGHRAVLPVATLIARFVWRRKAAHGNVRVPGSQGRARTQAVRDLATNLCPLFLFQTQ